MTDEHSDMLGLAARKLADSRQSSVMNSRSSRKTQKAALDDFQAIIRSTTVFFCCALLACHEGRGRSPSVSAIGGKTDFLTFQLNYNADKLINAKVELGQRSRT